MTPGRRRGRRGVGAPPRDPLPAYFGSATGATGTPQGRDRTPKTRATPPQAIPELQLLTDEDLERLGVLMEILERRGALAEAHGMPIRRTRDHPSGG